MSPELPWPDMWAGALGYAGEPAQLTSFSGMFFPSNGVIHRIRASDRAVVPGDPISVSGWNGMVTLPEGPTRLIYFKDDGVALNAYPVMCPM